MVFQDYGLFPWLNVRDNIGFGPKSRGRPSGRDQGHRRSLHRARRLAEFRRRLSAPALRRHEAARRHRARARQRRRDRADGRAVRRARRDDARAAAGRAGRDLVAHRADRAVRDPLDRGSDFSRRPRRGDVAGTRADRQRVRDRLDAAARYRQRRVQRMAAAVAHQGCTAITRARRVRFSCVWSHLARAANPAVTPPCRARYRDVSASAGPRA